MPTAPVPARVVPFLLGMGAVGLLLAAGGLGLTIGIASYSQLQKLGHLVYHEYQFKTLRLALTPARLTLLRALLAGAGVVGMVSLVFLHRTGGHLGSLRNEVLLGRKHFTSWLRRQPRWEQYWALGLLVVLLGTRLWYLVSYPLSTDEIASYDFFAKQGPLTVGTFYPIPNNHIFYNLLAWPLAASGLPALIAMRLPGLLLGLGGTVLGYVLLARLAGARLALAVMGLVGLAPLWVYYAVAGRGYYLQICCLQIGFFAVIELLKPNSRYVRLAWLAFVVGSVVGLYCVPSYAYPLVSLGAGIGVGFVWQRRWRALGHLLVATTVVALLTALLYTPVGLVSGWDRLLHNPYIAAKTPAEFWPSYRAFLYETAATLFGPTLRLSGPAWLTMAVAGGIFSCYWLKKSSFAQHTAAQLAALMLLIPLLLMMLQRVYAPSRVLLYLTYFGYLLVGIWLRKLPFRKLIPARWQSPLLLLIVLGIGGFRLYENQAQVRTLQHETYQIAAAYHWLRAQPATPGHPNRVWLHAIFHELFFAHYEQQEPPAQRDQLISHPAAASGGYDYLIIGRRPEDRKIVAPPNYWPRYHDDLVTIYQLSPSRPAHR